MPFYGNCCTVSVMKTTRREFIDESPFGVYVWQMPDGKIVGDDEGRFLSINSVKGDITKMTALTNAVKEFGIEVGKPLFLAGNRKVSDEEYEEQKSRMEDGLVPDQLDVPSLIEDMKFRDGR